MARPKVLTYKFTEQQKQKHIENLRLAHKHLTELYNQMLVTHGTKNYDVKRLETLVRNTLAMTLTVDAVEVE